MSVNKFNEMLNAPEFLNFLGYISNSKSAPYMNAAYDILMKLKPSLFNGQATPEIQTQISEVLAYFESNEDYEKCQELVKLKKQIEDIHVKD